MGKVILTLVLVSFLSSVYGQTYQGSFTKKSVIVDASSTVYCKKREKTRTVECTFTYNVQSDLLQIKSPERNNTVKMRQFRTAETRDGIKQYFAQDLSNGPTIVRNCFIFIKGAEVIQIQYECLPNKFFVIYHN